MGEALAENRLNLVMKLLDVAGREATRRTLRMESCTKEGLVDIDVAEAGDAPLIEEGALELGGPSRQATAENLRSEASLQRLWSHCAIKDFDLIRHEVEHPPELALIGEPEVDAIVEFQRQMLKAKRGGGSWRELENARHAEVNHDAGFVIEQEEEVFAAAADIFDPSCRYPCSGRIDAQWSHDAIEHADFEIGDRAPGDAVDEPETNGFDFW